MKERNEPIFNIEMSSQLRHIVMCRGYLLRGQRTRTILVLDKANPKSWLEVKLIPGPRGELKSTWHGAHLLRAKILAESKADTYVEPASTSGRHNELLALSTAIVNPVMHEPQFASARRNFAKDPSGMPGVLDYGNSHTKPNRSAFDFDPPDPLAQISATLQTQFAGFPQFDRRPSETLKCPGLHTMPGWSDLSCNEQKMFETEAAEVLSKGAQTYQDSGYLDSIESLITQSGISKALHTFLSQSR